MVEKTEKYIKVDLNEFKLHLRCKPEIDVMLYFNTPSRKFYLSVIALLIIEMKKKDNTISIPLQNHLDELVLLNRTIGKKAGSSKKEHLLPRIYRKWKYALPDLGKAPLFKIIGKKKRYDDSMDKVYIFNEREKDCWANLFEYMGSHENVRLKFALYKLSLGLKDAAIVYGDATLSSIDAWKNFIADLNQRLDDGADSEGIKVMRSEPEPIPRDEDLKQLAAGKQRRMIQLVMIGLIVIFAGLFFWHYNKSVPSIEVASVHNMAFPLPDKPSIAVLAFDNMTGDTAQEYFSDGISENIITTLSKSSSFFVVARNSTFRYKGEPADIKKIAEELGIRYVLEGSVQKSEDRVRISAQLIDAVVGNHLWAERYERDLQDIFSVQDEITMAIVTALQVKLTEGDQAYMWSRKNRDINVYMKFLEATSLVRQGTKESIIRYGQIGKEIVDMAPDSAFGYRILGWHNYHYAFFSKSGREYFEKAFKFGQKALSLDDSDASAHNLLSRIYLTRKNYEKAIAEAKRAVELEPNGALVHMLLGSTLSWAGRTDEAIVYLNQAIRLNPFPDYWYYYHLGRCYRQKGEYERALAFFEKSVHLNPDVWYNQLQLASIYVLLGRQEEAQAAAKKLLVLNPAFSVARSRKGWPYKNQSDLDLFFDALSKAGLPD